MARHPLLSEDELVQASAGLAWSREGDYLTKVVELASFRDAIAFVGRVADVAEALDHHPDITIAYRRVSLRVTTHDSGGLTERDVALARAVDQLA